MNKQEWTYNKNKDGVWNNEFCESKDQAIEEGRKELEGSFYVGRYVEPTIDIPNFEDIKEKMLETAYDEYGECSENWKIEIPKEKEIAVNSIIERLVLMTLKDHGCMPNFYGIEDIELVNE